MSALSSVLEQGPLRRAPLGHVAALEALPGLISGRHREAEKAVRRAHRTGVVDDFHRLRIRCKRLRYAIEFTGDLYGGDVKRYARQVASLQDELGLIQDAETAANRLQAIAFGEEGALLSRATVFAMGMVSQRCAAEAVTRLAKLPPAKHLVNGRLWDKARDTMDRRRQEAADAAAEAAEAAHRAAAEQAPEPAVPAHVRPALPSVPVPAASRRVRRATGAAAGATATGLASTWPAEQDRGAFGSCRHIDPATRNRRQGISSERHPDREEAGALKRAVRASRAGATRPPDRP